MINVFFDMDGVIAEWNEKATLEDIFSEGYFRNVSPNKVTINVLKNSLKNMLTQSHHKSVFLFYLQDMMTNQMKKIVLKKINDIFYQNMI